MRARLQSVARRVKASVRYRRGRAHRRLRKRSPAWSRRFVRGADHVRAVRFKLVPHRPNRPVEQTLHAYAAARPDARFLQIGAHDGTKLDPLRPIVLASRWRGVLVEPVPYVFDRLRERYGANERMTLENVAIAETSGTLDFYYVPEADGLWHSYDALGSFRRDVVVSHTHLIADIEDRVVSQPVNAITFDELCDRNGLETVDMIQIDTEGYDLNILRMIDFEARRPDIVVFEHLHLDRAERDEAQELFAESGYALVSDGMDTLALSPAAQQIPPVMETFRSAVDSLAEFEQ